MPLASAVGGKKEAGPFTEEQRQALQGVLSADQLALLCRQLPAGAQLVQWVGWERVVALLFDLLPGRVRPRGWLVLYVPAAEALRPLAQFTCDKPLTEGVRLYREGERCVLEYTWEGTKVKRAFAPIEGRWQEARSYTCREETVGGQRLRSETLGYPRTGATEYRLFAGDFSAPVWRVRFHTLYFPSELEPPRPYVFAAEEHLIYQRAGTVWEGPTDLSFTAEGQYDVEGNLTLRVRVWDEVRVAAPTLTSSDHVRFSIDPHPPQGQRRYLVEGDQWRRDTDEGRVWDLIVAPPTEEGREEDVLRLTTCRVQARGLEDVVAENPPQWRDLEDGYEVLVTLPAILFSPHLREWGLTVAVSDADDPARPRQERVMATSQRKGRDPSTLGRAIIAFLDPRQWEKAVGLRVARWLARAEELHAPRHLWERAEVYEQRGEPLAAYLFARALARRFPLDVHAPEALLKAGEAARVVTRTWREEPGLDQFLEGILHFPARQRELGFSVERGAGGLRLRYMGEEFRQLLQNYPWSPLRDRAAWALLELKAEEKPVSPAEWSTFLQDYPHSPLVPWASYRLQGKTGEPPQPPIREEMARAAVARHPQFQALQRDYDYGQCPLAYPVKRGKGAGDWSAWIMGVGLDLPDRFVTRQRFRVNAVTGQVVPEGGPLPVIIRRPRREVHVAGDYLLLRGEGIRRPVRLLKLAQVPNTYRNVTLGIENFGAAALSPDQRYVAFTVEAQNPALGLYDCYEREVSLLKVFVRGRAGRIAWSPDGTMLAYDWMPANGRWRVELYLPEAGTLEEGLPTEQFFAEGTATFAPGWSEDGRYLYFTLRYPNGQQQRVRWNRRTKKVERL